MKSIMAFIPAITGLVGIAVGAWLQHVFTIQQEQEKNLRELRLSTYQKFFEGQAKRLLAEQRKTEGDADEARKLRNEYASLVIGSRFPMAAFGERQVIENMAKHFSTMADTDVKVCEGSRDSWITDMNIYQHIRDQALQDRSEKVAASDLTVLLFNCKLPQ